MIRETLGNESLSKRQAIAGAGTDATAVVEFVCDRCRDPRLESLALNTVCDGKDNVSGSRIRKAAHANLRDHKRLVPFDIDPDAPPIS